MLSVPHLTSPKIWQVIESESGRAGLFGHGYTYSAHPVSCAVGLETIAIYERENLIEQVADSDLAVLIRGESGTGKEIVARTVHLLSSRAGAEFVKVNCAAIPRDLLESELFGYEKGAFTGATRTKTGRFEIADGGTMS